MKRTDSLSEGIVIWLVGWPIYYTLWPKRAPQAVRGGKYGAHDTIRQE